MCLHYLVKLIARVLSPYITYFSIGYRLWTFGIEFLLTVETTVFNRSTTASVVFTDMGNHAGEGEIANVEELRKRIVDEWERLDQRIIDGAVK